MTLATTDYSQIIDPEFYVHGNPDEVFTELRHNRPIGRHELPDGRPYWVLVKYKHQNYVHTNPAVFSTTHGVTIDTIRADGKDPASGKMLEFSVPKHHRKLRDDFRRLYNKRPIGKLENGIRSLAGRLLDDALAKSTFDFAADVANPMTSAVVFGLLGFPERDWLELFDLSRRSQEETHVPSAPGCPFHTSAADANNVLLRYMRRLLDPRSDDPVVGHIKDLHDSRYDGKTFTEQEVILNTLNIMQGGNSTTRHAASIGLQMLLENPDQLDLIYDDPALIPGMVEETVRWASPAMHLARIAARDIKIDGHQIKAGDIVTVWTLSSNRDEDVFRNPFAFDIRRSPNKHLGFLSGPHLCLGIHVARIELRILFEEIAKRRPSLRITGPVERVPSNFIAGIQTLPLEVR